MIGWILLLILYFIPSIVATAGDRKNVNAIFILNLLLGWTIIGWIVALVWACIVDDVRRNE